MEFYMIKIMQANGTQILGSNIFRSYQLASRGLKRPHVHPWTTVVKDN